MTTTPTHECRPLHVAGVLRSTCATHWWLPVPGTATAKPVTR
jgi:hypothetical protein